MLPRLFSEQFMGFRSTCQKSFLDLKSITTETFPNIPINIINKSEHSQMTNDFHLHFHSITGIYLCGFYLGVVRERRHAKLIFSNTIVCHEFAVQSFIPFTPLKTNMTLIMNIPFFGRTKFAEKTFSIKFQFEGKTRNEKKNPDARRNTFYDPFVISGFGVCFLRSGLGLHGRMTTDRCFFTFL